MQFVCSLMRTVVTSPAPIAKDFFEAHPGFWSFGSFIAAIVSLIVGGAGLYLIWGQVKAGREALASAATSAKAAADATRIAYAATRPWVKFRVSKAYLYFNAENLEQVGCQLNYIVENIGNTPAVDLRVVFNPVPVGRGATTDIAAELEKLKSKYLINRRVLFPHEAIDEGLSTNFPFEPQANEDMLGFKIVAAVIYRAALDGQEYWTPAVFGLQHETTPKDLIHRFYRGMGNVPSITMLLGDETPQPT